MNAPFSQYDLNVALLSMDIYNGQFRPKVNVSGPGFQIGEFTLKKYSESVLANNVYYPTGETDPGMGFTAAYYESTSGKGIVSYRGTDFNTTSGSTWHQRWDAFITDAIAGYPAAISGNTPQGTAALNFFNEIKLEFNKPALEVTGQSLGGGLAGFVAMANDAKATIYENMPFLAAAMGYYYDNHTSITDSVSVRMGQAGAYVRSKIGLIESYAVDAGRESNGTGSESPEFLVNARALMDNRYLSHYGLKTTTGIINHSGITDGFEIHGQSLMILHMYGVNYTFSNGGNWQFASDMMMNRIYLNPIADGLGINDRDADNDGFKDYEGAGQSGDKMASIIAYTVMSTGARPFGDKAAHSLFDDMNDVGSLIAADQNWNALKTGSVIDHIGNVTAAFAGALALSRSTNSAHQSGVLKSDGTGVIYVDMNLARSVEGMARIHVFFGSSASRSGIGQARAVRQRASDRRSRILH